MNIDPKAYIEAMRFLPQHFDEIIRVEGNYQIERLWNGNYSLWRRSVYSSQWSWVGDIHKSYPAAEYVAMIGKPYDPSDDSDCTVVYQGDSLDEAITSLWNHRYEATS